MSQVDKYLDGNNYFLILLFIFNYQITMYRNVLTLLNLIDYDNKYVIFDIILLNLVSAGNKNKLGNEIFVLQHFSTFYFKYLISI